MAQISAAQSSGFLLRKAELLAVLTTVLVVLISRLAHLDLIWIEEAYGMAAAGQVLRGAALYRDIWFDKPPLYALYYAAFGAGTGLPLRLAGTLLVLVTAAAAALAALRLWSRDAAVPAFVLTCFCLTFWVPSAVMAVTPDVLAISLHFLAVAAAVSGYGLLAGAAAGVAVWANSKGLVVLLIALLWTWRRPIPVLMGFVATQAVGFLLIDVTSFWQQVWNWGFHYSRDTFIDSPVREFARRTGGWLWFHAGIVVAATIAFIRLRGQRWRFLLWLSLSLATVAAGLRFFPRYYFALLPPAILLAAYGWTVLQPRVRLISLLLLSIPVARFGPRYVDLLAGGGADWSDLALMRDSRAASAILKQRARPDNTLLVWGYRPDIYVFSSLPAGTRYLDSQPLTGVLADRHISQSRPTFPAWAEAHREDLSRAPAPRFVVDGLGPLNPSLAISGFSDLQPWLKRYRIVATTAHSVIYELQDHPE